MNIIRNADELTFSSDLLREEIRKAKLSQYKIAKALNITDKTFSKKMNGDSDWTLREIQQIQAILKDIDICLVFGLKKVG
ncbi:MAG: hypothetical protein U0O22_04020 [Acutalibacteraceae bacterium]